jgi:hypothetical protein
MAEINDSLAGRYAEPFRYAALQFIRLLEDEPWELQGIESPGQGITIEMRLRTTSGAWYSLFVVKRGPSMSEDILQAMVGTHLDYVRGPGIAPTHI